MYRCKENILQFDTALWGLMRLGGNRKTLGLNCEGVVDDIAFVQSARDRRKEVRKETDVGNEF